MESKTAQYSRYGRDPTHEELEFAANFSFNLDYSPRFFSLPDDSPEKLKIKAYENDLIIDFFAGEGIFKQERRKRKTARKSKRKTSK